MAHDPPRSAAPGAVVDGGDTEVVAAGSPGERALSADDELPVVARLVIEIRSDGRRTVARGAMEDVASGAKTAVVARGESPMRLALDLARALTRLPGLAVRQTVRGLLGRGSPRR